MDLEEIERDIKSISAQKEALLNALKNVDGALQYLSQKKAEVERIKAEAEIEKELMEEKQEDE